MQVESFGPDDFFCLQKGAKEERESLAKQLAGMAASSNGGGRTPPFSSAWAEQSLKSIMALLKLSDWDPDLMFKFKDAILDKVSLTRHITATSINDVTDTPSHLWTRWARQGRGLRRT